MSGIIVTAIGSEIGIDLDSSAHWETVMRGHAGANLLPVVASNRIGTERAGNERDQITFYGSSFIDDNNGQIAAKANRADECSIVARFDFDDLAMQRDRWGVFRDLRPDLYGSLLTLDGRTHA